MKFSVKKSIVMVYVAVFVFGFLPMFVQAAQSTTAGNTGITYECGDGVTAGDCTFDDLIKATLKVVDWGRDIGLSISVIVLIIAGFRYMMSEGNPGKLREANHMFVQVGWGIAFIMGAWLIVHLITSALLAPGFETLI